MKLSIAAQISLAIAVAIMIAFFSYQTALVIGYADLTDDVIENAFGKFKILADKKKHIYDE